MEPNQKCLTIAFWTLGDWFHRLGGAATYPGFRESDIPLYVAQALAAHLDITLSVERDFVDTRFQDAAAAVIAEVNESIRRIAAPPEESIALLKGFVEYADEKVNRMRDEESQRWSDLVAAVRQLQLNE